MSTPFIFRNIYPNLRYFMSLGRMGYNSINKIRNIGSMRPDQSSVLPRSYTVCNTNTYDSEYTLNLLEGNYPNDISGSMYITQCLGVPNAFMVGDTNLIRMDFNENEVTIKNRLLWTPVAIARQALKKSIHKFDYFGLMYLSPGLGLFSYTEGMYLLPDGRLSVTSDVDRPWIIDKESLRAITPIGMRSEWLPMMADKAGEVMGNLFSGYSNSHVMYPDVKTNETFFVSYQQKQADGCHPVQLNVWNGYEDFKTYNVVDDDGESIEIKQSIHELIFTKDYILLADTAFIVGTEMLTPWKNAPLPYEKTVVYIIDRRDLKSNTDVIAKKVDVDEPCIHLIAEYENPNDLITVYMLHTPATNTAEILKPYDRTLDGELFPNRAIGYGTLPVLDLSSIGKHTFDMAKKGVVNSKYIRDEKFCWGPYLYTYMDRQVEHFNKQDLYIMFKGFNKDILPKRIFEAYKDIEDRKIPVDRLVDNSVKNNNSIVKVDNKLFEITDSYEMPDDVLLYTISCIKSKGKGYVLAGVCTETVSNQSSGHEYWIFDGDNLSIGPVCKLGHKQLCNSTIFHTIFINQEVEDTLEEKQKTYHIPIRQDYPKEELKLWDPSVLKVFEDIIYPYFEGENPRILEEYSRRRVEDVVVPEELIGEYFVDNPKASAEKMTQEAHRLFKTTGWKKEYHKNNLLVESKPIKGDLEQSGVHVTRSHGLVNASAKETFDMLVSPEGYAVIDPISKKEDHKRPPLQVFDWKENSRLEISLASTNLPMMPESEFVVLNAIDKNEMLFVSKSVLHESVPGSSKYSNFYNEAIKERALNTFAIKVEALTESKCMVKCINFADMCGKSSAGMNNFVNKKLFFPPLYKRIQKKMLELDRDLY